MTKAARGGLAWMFALMLVIGACAGTPASTPAEPTAAAPDQPAGAPDATAGSPAVPPAADGPGGGGPATVVLGSRTLEFSDISYCQISPTAVNIGASSADGAGVLLVQGDPDTPAEFLISIARLGEFGYGYALATGGLAPAVSVSGGTLEISAQVYTGTAAVGETETAIIQVHCDDQPVAGGETPSADDGTPAPGGEGGLASGSATVTIGGQTYELFTAEPPLCSLGIGVQASMASADKQASIDVYTVGSTGLINFARILEGEYWTPSGGQEAFVVSGSTAIWSGAMSNLYGDGQQHVTITITCEGGA